MVLVALLVCLIPTTIGGLLSAIGIAGMDRMVRANVIATSGRAIEAAGDVDVLLLDKTGTITLGNRLATHFLPAPGTDHQGRSSPTSAQLASLSDETPEGRSIVVLAKQRLQHPGTRCRGPPRCTSFHKFSAHDPHERRGPRRSAPGPEGRGRRGPRRSYELARRHLVPGRVSAPTMDDGRAKSRARHAARRRRWSPRPRRGSIFEGRPQGRHPRALRRASEDGHQPPVMITGDNPLTAAAIAAEAGVDDFLAQATPEMPSSKLIRRYQAVAGASGGHDRRRHQRCAGARPGRRGGGHEHWHPGRASEAGNMVDLDSNPTKLIEIVDDRQTDC